MESCEPEAPSPCCHSGASVLAVPSPPELNPEEATLLLGAARTGLRTALLREEGDEADPPPGVLSLPASVFVSLYLEGDLRGCLGSVGAGGPLLRQTREVAARVLSADKRFQPLKPPDLARVLIEVSVLGPFHEVAPAERAALPGCLRLGEHGVMVRDQGHRGIFLPQVPSRMGWSSDRFLAEVCRKAGLSPQAWRQASSDVALFRSLVLRARMEVEKDGPPAPAPAAGDEGKVGGPA